MTDSIEHSFNTVNMIEKVDSPSIMAFTHSDKIKQLVAVQKQGSSLAQTSIKTLISMLQR
jgi:hypothetical protein